MPLEPPLAPGRQLLHYRLIRQIGSGGMGAVYEAEDMRLGRPVALKLLPAAVSHDREARARFLREARAASAIDHPNLCTIHAIEETAEGVLLLVMTLYRGQTLADLIRSGRMDAARIAGIGRQMAAGLHAAHMAGIIHRDIKPGNVFVLPSGDIKILDFGLSRLSQQPAITAPHQVMGTLAYMAPEQLAGAALDHRVDIWALGAVVYEMAASHPPFHHAAPAAVMAAISRADYVPLPQLRPDLPARLHHAVERALRVHPHERHGSAAELQRLLEPPAGSAGAGATASPAATPVVQSVITVKWSAGEASREATATAPVVGRPAAPKTASAIAIAVLPLQNMSSDPENEYFSDGLTDDLISALGHIPNLRVVSRASAFAFKGKAQNVQEIGQTLSVGVVLEGSVRRSGQRVRVAVQLTDVHSGFQLWTARFDREMKDVFDLQDELTTALVETIRSKLAPDLAEAAPAATRNAPESAAYEAYLKGRYHWNQRSAEDLQLSGRYFEQALAIDPGYAAAHAGLADYYILLGLFGLRSPGEAWPLGRESAERAIALDPQLPEAHLALAHVLLFYDWNWAAALKEILRALELNPQRGESYVTYVYYLTTQGMLEEALQQTRRGLRYDPLSIELLACEAVLHTYIGDHETSMLLARQALEIAPHQIELHYALGLASHGAGKAEESVSAFERGVRESRLPILLGWLAEAHVKNRNYAKAREILEQLLEHARTGTVMPIAVAIAAAALEEHDLAFEWLERAAECRDIMLGYVAVLPSLKPLHGDPRFEELIGRMGLRRPAMGRRQR